MNNCIHSDPTMIEVLFLLMVDMSSSNKIYTEILTSLCVTAICLILEQN